MRLHYLQHVWFEDLGIIKEWAENNQFEITRTAFFDNEPLPLVNDIDWLIIMGGPMNVYEEGQYQWLAEEKEFIKEAIDNGKIVLGICLGAQLIADVLGAQVVKNEHAEIGWFPIQAIRDHKSLASNMLPDEFRVFHWHGDRFEVPEGAVLFAKVLLALIKHFHIIMTLLLGYNFILSLRRKGSRD